MWQPPTLQCFLHFHLTASFTSTGVSWHLLVKLGTTIQYNINAFTGQRNCSFVSLTISCASRYKNIWLCVRMFLVFRTSSIIYSDCSTVWPVFASFLQLFLFASAFKGPVCACKTSTAKSSESLYANCLNFCPVLSDCTPWYFGSPHLAQTWQKEILRM